MSYLSREEENNQAVNEALEGLHNWTAEGCSCHFSILQQGYAASICKLRVLREKCSAASWEITVNELRGLRAGARKSVCSSLWKMCTREWQNNLGKAIPWLYSTTVRVERQRIYTDLWKNTCKTSLPREQYHFTLAAGREWSNVCVCPCPYTGKEGKAKEAKYNIWL